MDCDAKQAPNGRVPPKVEEKKQDERGPVDGAKDPRRASPLRIG